VAAFVRIENPARDSVEREIAVMERNKQVVLTFIEAMGCSDAVAAVPCLDPEAFTLAKGFGKFAGVRHYDTIVGTIDAFKALLPTGLRPAIQSVTAEGDRVVVEFEGNAVARDGKPYCNQYCMVFTLRDGRIRQVNEYFCNILADEVLWPLVQEMMGGAAAT
jgi:limonene-1,2-epoxide hydrolase